MDVYDTEDLGKAIRTLRKAKGWTQVELAEWLGVNPVTVGRLEHGEAVAMTIAVRAVNMVGAHIVLVPRTGTTSAASGDARG
jgi:DNA-binding XRE family transcriptional regulator